MVHAGAMLPTSALGKLQGELGRWMALGCLSPRYLYSRLCAPASGETRNCSAPHPGRFRRSRFSTTRLACRRGVPESGRPAVHDVPVAREGAAVARPPQVDSRKGSGGAESASAPCVPPSAAVAAAVLVASAVSLASR